MYSSSDYRCPELEKQVTALTPENKELKERLASLSRPPCRLSLPGESTRRQTPGGCAGGKGGRVGAAMRVRAGADRSTQKIESIL
jgi:hypothetical protein